MSTEQSGHVGIASRGLFDPPFRHCQMVKSIENRTCSLVVPMKDSSSLSSSSAVFGALRSPPRPLPPRPLEPLVAPASPRSRVVRVCRSGSSVRGRRMLPHVSFSRPRVDRVEKRSLAMRLSVHSGIGNVGTHSAPSRRDSNSGAATGLR